MELRRRRHWMAVSCQTSPHSRLTCKCVCCHYWQMYHSKPIDLSSSNSTCAKSRQSLTCSYRWHAPRLSHINGRVLAVLCCIFSNEDQPCLLWQRVSAVLTWQRRWQHPSSLRHLIHNLKHWYRAVRLSGRKKMFLHLTAPAPRGLNLWEL